MDKKHTEETKEKMRGRIPWNKGLKGWTKDTKAGFQKGHGNFPGAEKGWFTTEKVSGENNINYKDGNRCGEGYPGEFKRIRKTLLEDNHYCTNCFKKIIIQTPSEHLVVHHIDCNINNNKLNNLQVLCNSCHRKLHIALKRRTKEDK
jgi:hypothetical protein